MHRGIEIRRKIIQIAGSTCLVSLPKTWINEHNVKKGDEVEVTAEGSKVIVQPNSATLTEALNIKIKDSKNFPDRTINVPFRQGYDKLTFEFNDPTAMEKIEHSVERLLGFEIVDQRSNSCTIKSFTTVEDQDFEKLLKRIFFLILNMAKDSADALEKHEIKTLRSIGDIERTVEKFSQFSMRLVNKDNSRKPRELTFQFATAWTLEQISDSFAAFCNTVTDKNLKLSPSVIKTYRAIVNLFEDFNKVYYNRDYEKMMKVRAQMTKLKKECYALVGKTDGKVAISMVTIVERLVELGLLFI